MEGASHRISAAALRSRGLITVSGRSVSWKATILPAGRDYLASVDGSDPPIPRQGNKAVTQQLVDDVVSAGGVLRVPGQTGISLVASITAGVLRWLSGWASLRRANV